MDVVHDSIRNAYWFCKASQMESQEIVSKALYKSMNTKTTVTSLPPTVVWTESHLVPDTAIYRWRNTNQNDESKHFSVRC